MTRHSTDAHWPEVAAAAGTWWDEAPAPRRAAAAPQTRVEEPEWSGVAQAALAWWESAPSKKTRRAPVVKARARDAAPAQWPEVAAAASVWWDETFESGVYAKAGVRKTYVA